MSDAEKIAREIAELYTDDPHHARDIEKALLAAEARGYAAAREQAAEVAVNEGTSPETNAFAEWYRHGQRIAAAIRKMEPNT